MERIDIGYTIVEIIKKYRYVVLVLAIGILLMLLPEGKKDTVTDPNGLQETTDEDNPEKKLEQILSKIKGAGEVAVMLTYASGAETVYQTDQDVSQGEKSKSDKIDTIIITDAERNQAGLIQRVDPPVYLGAVIVCQGADNPSVKLSIVEAVSRATGLSTDKICVLKMK